MPFFSFDYRVYLKENSDVLNKENKPSVSTLLKDFNILFRYRYALPYTMMTIMPMGGHRIMKLMKTVVPIASPLKAAKFAKSAGWSATSGI